MSQVTLKHVRFEAFICLAAVLLICGCGRKKTSVTHSSPNQPTTSEKVEAPPPLVVSKRYQGAQKARIEGNYAIVILANGRKTMDPVASLLPDDLEWLTNLSKEHALPAGKSSIVYVATTAPLKKTVQVSKTEDSLETVQLCPPNVIRDQIGGTCMIYARVHWLDIAGYYVDLGTIYKIINDTPPDHPWTSARYVNGLSSIMTGFETKPVIHRVPPQEEPFVWAREELRHGHPILAALPKEVWQALPPGFIAAHPWNGGSVGHQIVVNGFTWNEQTHQGTFHVINSWAELTEFDLTTEAAKGGTLMIEESLSPIGEPKPVEVKEVVETVTFVKTAGSTNLYEVRTNQGSRRIAAPSEGRARELVEQGR